MAYHYANKTYKGKNIIMGETMQKRLSKLLSIILVLGFISFTFTNSAEAKTSAGKVTWTKLETPNSSNLYEVAINDQGIQVAVGTYGSIMRSDGTSWKNIKINYKPSLVTVTTNGKEFVAGGKDGLLSSKDGSKWSRITVNMPAVGKLLTKNEIAKLKKDYNLSLDAKAKASQDINCEHAIWDGKQYVAVGTWYYDVPPSKELINAGFRYPLSYLIITSKDGQNWNVDKINQPIKKIVFNGSSYVGISNYNMITSKDLKKWKEVYDELNFRNIDVANGKFFAVHYDDSYDRYLKYLYTSSDGLKWNKTKLNIELANKSYTFLWDGKQYIMAGNLENIAASKNLKSWEMIYSETEPYETKSNLLGASIYCMKYENGKLVAVGSDGFIGTVNGTLDTKDPNNSWTVLHEGSFADFSNLEYSNKRYVAYGEGYSSLWESCNGTDWVESRVLPNRTVDRILWQDLTVKDNTFLAAGNIPYEDEKTYYRSTEPGVWKEYKLPVSSYIKEFSVNNNLFYCKVNQGYLTSKDGITWSKVKKVTNTVMKKTVTNGKVFLGINYQNKIYSSKDGKKWSKLDIPRVPNATATDIHWNGKQFLIIGSGYDQNWFDDSFGFNAVSKDGVNWKVKNFYGYLFYTNITWGKGIYVARPAGLGEENRMVSSSNGLDFTAASNTSYYEMRKVIWDGTKFVAVGKDSIILIGTLQ